MADTIEPDNVDAFFKPKSVAVLGASADPGKIGHRIVHNLKSGGFAGKVYPVSRSSDEILGYRTIHSLRDAPQGTDLVLIAIPVAAAPDGIEDAIAIKAKAVVLYTAGFAESDGEGPEIQRALRQRLDQVPLRVIGPNCAGVRNFNRNVNGTFLAYPPPPAGGVMLVSQSGSFGNAAYAALTDLNAGLSLFASIGNMIDVDHADLIRTSAADADTKAIACFCERVDDHDRLVAAVAEVAPAKPIVILKAGRTVAGQRAAMLHTGSRSSDDASDLYRRLESAGANVVYTMQEFFDVAAAFAKLDGQLPRSLKTSVFSVSGGPSVVTADHCDEEGLILTPLGERLEHLRPHVPIFAALGNPVEVTGQTKREHYPAIVGAMVRDRDVDSLIGVCIGQDIPEFGFILAEARATVPVIACAVAPKLEEIVRDANIPNYPSVDRAVKVMRHMATRGTWLAARG